MHRSLGTHISKVKSATLDKWTEEQLENMQTMGNARAKEIYEANVPPHYPIPMEGASSHSLENWIKAKYDRKEFMQRGGARVTPSSSPAPSPSRERRDRESEAERAKRRAEREKRRADRERRREREQEREREREQIQAPPPPTPTNERAQRIPAPTPSPTPAVTSPAVPKPSTDLNELLGFGTSTPSTPSTVPTQSAPKVDKASIMSLYATPIQPSHGVPTMQPIHTTNHMRVAPNYNINLGPTYGAAPTPYMVAPTAYSVPYQAYPAGYQYGAAPMTGMVGYGMTQPQVRLN